MIDDGDRMARAGNYVLGLMDDKERERAEHDLERDGAFRDAVVEIAERMHMFDLPDTAAAAPDAMWQAVSARIADLPHMQGRRVGDQLAGQASLAKARRIGLHSVPGWRGMLATACLIAAFAAGYLTGRL